MKPDRRFGPRDEEQHPPVAFEPGPYAGRSAASHIYWRDRYLRTLPRDVLLQEAAFIRAAGAPSTADEYEAIAREAGE